MYEWSSLKYEDLPQKVELDTKWHRTIKGLVKRTGLTGPEYSVGFLTTDKYETREGSDFPVEPPDERRFLLRPELWGTPQKPLFVTRPIEGRRSESGPINYPRSVEWHGHLYHAIAVGTIHTHPTWSSADMSPGDWWRQLTRPDKGKAFSMVAHRSGNRMVFLTLKSKDNFLNGVRIRDYPRTKAKPSLPRRIRQDLEVVQPGRAWVWSYRQMRRWEKRIAPLLEAAVYYGKPGRTLKRVA